MIYYSATNGGFYTSEIHSTSIPDDAVEITPETHTALLTTQSNGKIITANNAGYPEAIDPPAPDMEQILTNLSNRVQSMLDAKVREYGYDNIQSACSYATSENRTFAAEGKTCTKWRDAVWATCHAFYKEIEAETIPVPTEESFILMLPQIEWPEPKTGFSRLWASVFG